VGDIAKAGRKCNVDSGIGLIILSIGLGVGMSPEVSMLAAP
jgi:hypothetical protein